MPLSAVAARFPFPVRRLCAIAEQLAASGDVGEFRERLSAALRSEGLPAELIDLPTPAPLGERVAAALADGIGVDPGGFALRLDQATRPMLLVNVLTPPESPELLPLVRAALCAGLTASQRVDELRRELTTLHEVGQWVVGTRELEALLEWAAQSLALNLEADVYLMFPDEARVSLVVRAVARGPRELLGLALPLAHPERSLAASVFHSRQVITVEDSDHEPRTWEVRKRSGGRAYLAVPMVVRDAAIGSVIVVETRGTRRFSPDEIQRCSSIANQLAVAVENARLYSDLSRSYSDLARTQHQLVERERLAALGELSAIVAHEVRNPLGAIFNALLALKRRLGDDPAKRRLLAILIEESERLDGVVRDLLEFARPNAPSLVPQSIDAVIKDAIASAARDAPGTVDVALELPAELPLVALDAPLFRQAVINLISNALQAVGPSGRIGIRLSCAAGERVVLEIADTGAGIPPEHLGRIFEPFYTTRASGTGLGLALVKRVVERHKGKIEVHSEVGKGSRFRLELPANPA